MLTNGDYIGGTKKFGHRPTAPTPTGWTIPLADTAKRVLEAIPFYPEQTNVHKPAKQLKLSSSTVAAAVQSGSRQYLIAEDGYWISRLKPDLSNI